MPLTGNLVCVINQCMLAMKMKQLAIDTNIETAFIRRGTNVVAGTSGSESEVFLQVNNF